MKRLCLSLALAVSMATPALAVDEHVILKTKTGEHAVFEVPKEVNGVSAFFASFAIPGAGQVMTEEYGYALLHFSAGTGAWGSLANPALDPTSRSIALVFALLVSGMSGYGAASAATESNRKRDRLIRFHETGEVGPAEAAPPND